MTADQLATELAAVGARVLGPVPSLDRVLDLIEKTAHIDAAVLDINLRGEMVYPAADRLVERKVPFVFTTGYDTSSIPARFEHIPRCEKPAQASEITEALKRALCAQG